MPATLPPDFPPMDLRICQPDRREPGLKVFNIRPGGAGDNRTKTGWVVAVDQAGDVAWYYKSEEPIGDIRDMGNGNLICNRTDGRLVEIDREGNIQRHWYATGKWESKTPPAGGIPIEAPAFHHCLVPMKNGNLLVTSIEIRR